VKLRHYGLLANRNRRVRLAQARAALPPAPAEPASTPDLPTEPEIPPGLPRDCPYCHCQANWIFVAIRAPQMHRHPRAPPACLVA
jgi:hypothetical protein